MRKIFVFLFGLLILAFLVIAMIVVTRTVMTAKPLSPSAASPPDFMQVDKNAAAQRLSKALQFKTISVQDRKAAEAVIYDDEFTKFQDWLAETYPAFHSVVSTERVADLTPVHTWTGSDGSLDPLVFLAHQDVVPALASTNGWDYPPFDGTIAEGFIYGRGTLDDKGSLIGIVEAANALAESGFTPKRTLIFVFGHDEEVTGYGAKAAADLLQSRGISPYAVFDEGGAVVSGVVMDGQAAVLGVAEKGYLTLTLTSEAVGGHSSTPPDYTAIGSLARAIAAIEANPFKRDFDPVTKEMIAALAPHQPFIKRALMSNLWLFGPLVKRSLEESDTTRALLGTTIAPTIINAGFKENAMPREAVALVNFRLHSRDSVQSVIDHVTRVIDNPRIKITQPESLDSEASPISQIGTGPYLMIADVLSRSFDGVPIVPNTVTGATDSRFFTNITSDIYRFTPIQTTAEDLKGFHGINERISVDAHARSIQVYHLLMRESGKNP